MNSSISAVEGGRRRVRTVLSAMIALLALAVLCAGLLGMHSATVDHAMLIGHASAAPSSAAMTAAPVLVGDDAAGTGVMVTGTATLPAALNNGALCGSACQVDCAMVGATCAVLFVLAPIVLLAQSPALYLRLLAASGSVRESVAVSAREGRRPSLSVLCISRV